MTTQTLVAGVRDYVADLASRVALVLAVPVYEYPPASVTASCALVLPGDPFIGDRMTACVYPVQTLVRFVSAVLDQDGAYAECYRAIDVLMPTFPTSPVSVAARRWSNETYVCADFAVTESLTLPTRPKGP